LVLCQSACSSDEAEFYAPLSVKIRAPTSAQLTQSGILRTMVHGADYYAPPRA
jgi:hypothetical protein